MKVSKLQLGLFILSGALIILGLTFLVNAMEVARLFPAYYDISNVLAKYIVVIAVMACGIMLFSNVAVTVRDKSLRNGLTIGITTFSTVLTLPLVYVFIAIFPAAANGTIGAVGEIMGVDKIILGFQDWFGTGGGLYAIYAALLVVSIVFLAFPLVTGVLAVKGKTIGVGTLSTGKKGFGIVVLPVIAKQSAE